MSYLIGPWSWREPGEQDGAAPNPSTNYVYIMNGRGERLLDVLPQQILGRIPTKAEIIDIATKICNAVNLTDRAVFLAKLTPPPKEKQ